MCNRTDDRPTAKGKSCGDKVDGAIYSFFHRIGIFCASRPKTTLGISILIAAICGAGIARINPESRPEKLWVPQGTEAEVETDAYESFFPRTSRFNNVLVSASNSGGNALTRDHLISTMELHEKIEKGTIKAPEGEETEGQTYSLTSLCSPGGTACASYDPSDPICSCLVVSVLKMWNYDLATLQADDDVLTTLGGYGSRKDLEGVLGNAVFDENDALISAEAISLNYFLADRSRVENGGEIDPINEEWEEAVFLKSVEDVPSTSGIRVNYISSRSFSDEFGGAISGDLIFVQVSYVIAFVFLGATLGSKFVCGQGSRWAMSFAAVMLVALSTLAGIGVSSLVGLLYGPVHSILPFVLLGIGIDDSFVIANAFDRERKVGRSQETDEGIIQRAGRALGRAGASITVTSATDLVAFAISSSSSLPALASFCAYASISIFFLWALSATFFTACMAIDEKRQRDNRRDCLCWMKRNGGIEEEEDDTDKGAEEGFISKYFRKYHAPAILSVPGKVIVLFAFAGIFGYGIYGFINLPVEDSERNFIPGGSYINDYIDAADRYFPSSGTALFVTFQKGEDIYDKRVELSKLNKRLTGLSVKPPYIAEPDSESTYQNVMTGLGLYLATNGTGDIGGVALGEDNWPTTYEDFVTTVKNYTSFQSPGRTYSQDVSYSEDMSTIEAYKVELEYVRLTKEYRGETIEDADRQIDAMDATREMVESWSDLPSSFPYSDKFLAIEGFKSISRELYRNTGLAIACVGVIVLLTVANFMAAFLITLNVAFCIVEILGFMYAAGIVIDSVSVINIVLAVGLSVDYSAHIGHSFLVKGGSNKNVRATEALADIGASVLNGALSTFLAVAILLASSSYVFRTLSIQFALTVGLGVMHGLVLLPVLLSLIGPAPFASAEMPGSEASDDLELSENKNEGEDNFDEDGDEV